MADEIPAALSDRIEIITEAILGQPTSRNRCERRWGKRGSLSVCTRGKDRGCWYDHEAGEGGGPVALIMRLYGVNFHGAVQIAQKILGDQPQAWRPPKRCVAVDQDDGGSHRVAIALRLWREATEVAGTLAEIYLEGRGIDVSDHALGHALRWHQSSSAMLALMTDPITAQPCGVHRTFLDADARKIERKMLGRQGVIRLSADEEVTTSLSLSEGIEDALSILISGWTPVWAATSAGALARFPPLSGIEALTIFADFDDAGLAAARHCGEAWKLDGRQVAVCTVGGRHD